MTVRADRARSVRGNCGGKMKYSLAVFDMDGTILDTLDDLTDTLNMSLA